jgi:hypothetical protein
MKPHIVRAHPVQLPERQQRQNCERDRLQYVKPEPAIRASLPDQLACSIVRPDEYEEGEISRNVDRYHRQTESGRLSRLLRAVSSPPMAAVAKELRE